MQKNEVLMTVTSEFNSYVNAYNSCNYTVDDIYKTQKNVNLNFAIVNLEFENFGKYYTPQGWCIRKFIALPCAIWSGLVKTIYHLTKAIFIGIFKARLDGGAYFQSQLYSTGRDLQESMGWVLSIFSDKYGQYHIQESKYHKYLYDLNVKQVSTEKTSTVLTSSKSPNNIKVLVEPAPGDTNPEQFAKLSKEKRDDEDFVYKVIDQSLILENIPQILAHVEETALNSEKVALLVLDKNPLYFCNLGEQVRNNVNVVTKALSGCVSEIDSKTIFEFAGENAKKQKEVALLLLDRDPCYIEHLDPSIRSDEDVVARAIQRSANVAEFQKVMSFVDVSLITKHESILSALGVKGFEYLSMLGDVFFEDVNFVGTVIRICKTEAEAELVIERAGAQPKQSYWVAALILKISPFCLKYFDYDIKDNGHIVAEAIRQCKTLDEAKQVLGFASPVAKNDIIVGVALLEKDLNLFNEFDVVLKDSSLFISEILKKFDKESFIKIWEQVSDVIKNNKFVNSEIKEKYPDLIAC